MKTVFTCLLACLLFIAHAQIQRCHTDEYLQQLKNSDPGLESRMELARQQALRFRNAPAAQKSGARAMITIPVVVHVMHNGEALGAGANISDAQILSQFEVLNEDYKALNSDIASVPAHFAAITGNVDLEFCLAQLDPEGNPTTGIDRVSMGASGTWSDNRKPGTIWDNSQYLNLWVAPISGGTLGYATFPGTSPDADGVVIDYRYFGKAPANPFSSDFDLGRTATHEIGHWLGLEHTFQGGCSGTSASDCATQGDRICDTPPTANANYGCNLSTTRNTCTETPANLPDMWMNFMDYMDDACLFMFTQEQAAEMRAVLNTSRASIQNSVACDASNLFSFSGKVVDAQTGQGVEFAKVLFTGTGKYEVETDADGNFSSQNFREGTYDVYAGKWGYMTFRYSANTFIDAGTTSLTIPIEPGFYYDDFILDFGWGASGTASSGLWERGFPIETTYNGDASNPGEDVPGDFGDDCYVTGNGGGSAGNDDVDEGNAVLTSPLFDLTGYQEPYISYHRWFFNGGGQGTPDDQLTLTLSNGTQTVTLETVDASSSSSQWTFQNFRVKDFITPTNTMLFSLETSDQSGTGHLVEAGLDLFQVVDSLPSAAFALPSEDALSFFVYPNPAHGLVHIQWIKPVQQFLIHISDASGKLVFAQRIDGNKNFHSIDVSSLPDGIYLIKATSGRSVTQRKLVVMR